MGFVILRLALFIRCPDSTQTILLAIYPQFKYRVLFCRLISAHFLIPVLTALLLTGCLSPITLEHAVMEYDRRVHTIQSDMLLLNIARTKYHVPGHFTTVSSIAATFDFRVDTAIRGIFSTPKTSFA